MSKNKMKQQLNEQFARMQKLAGIIVENQMNEDAIQIDLLKLKALIKALKSRGGSREDKEDYKEIANLLQNKKFDEVAEYIHYLDTSPNEMVYDEIKNHYPELWNILFEDDPSGYISLAKPKKNIQVN